MVSRYRFLETILKGNHFDRTNRFPLEKRDVPPESEWLERMDVGNLFEGIHSRRQIGSLRKVCHVRLFESLSHSAHHVFLSIPICPVNMVFLKKVYRETSLSAARALESLALHSC